MDYFAKKQWIRIAICAVLVAAIVLAMTGVFSGTESLKYDPSAKKLAAGESEAEAAMQGFGGDVTAHLVLEGNTVKELTIDTPNETEGLGKRASDAEFTDQFIGKDGPFTFGENGVEALSGATVTSTAALKAINKAITGEEAAEEPAAEERAKEPEAAAADENAITATEQGFGGDVTVHVTLDGDKIQALTIDTPNETDGLGKKASEEKFTDQFIGKSGPFTYGEDGIEALTGATITSNAALKAINSVVPAAEQKEEAAATEEPAAEATAEPVAEATAEPAPEATEAPAEKAETKQEAEECGENIIYYMDHRRSALIRLGSDAAHQICCKAVSDVDTDDNGKYCAEGNTDRTGNRLYNTDYSR